MWRRSESGEFDFRTIQTGHGIAISDGQGVTASVGLERQRADGHYCGFSVSFRWSRLEMAQSGTVFEPSLGLMALLRSGPTETGPGVRLTASLKPVLRLGHVFQESETSPGGISPTMGARINSQDRVELPIRFFRTISARSAKRIAVF